MTSLPPGINTAMQIATAHTARQADAYRVAVESQSWVRRGVAPLLDALAEDIARITAYCENFAGAILDIEKLLEAQVDAS